MSSENALVKKVANEALRLMKDAGFEIANKLDILVDPKLPFMGYSTKRGGSNIIVVSGEALGSGMIEGLLVHEMSHVYRTNMHHPSHNRRLLDKVGKLVGREYHLTRSYEITVIQEAVNHVQDLYADDIAFRVFQQETFPTNRIFDFFLDWINNRPVTPKDEESVWQNMQIMLNNCFVSSDMARHKVTDIDGRAEAKIQEFLAHNNDQMKKEFSYFREFMTNLKEDPTEGEFEEGLTAYLQRIITRARELIEEQSVIHP
jgi:hypothetical protein